MKFKFLFFIISSILLLQSCTKEKCTHLYEGVFYTPVYQPMSSLRTVNIQAAKPVTDNGKIFKKGNYIYLNEVNKGFHIIDNTNPAAPRNIAFVSVPGNIDMAAKGNYLLVDNYVDLLTFDISNPVAIQLVNRKQNALPYRQYNYGFFEDSAKGIIVGFDKRVEKSENDCSFGGNWWPERGGVFWAGNSGSGLSSFQSAPIGGGNGQAGSLSRFALLNNYLYIAGRYTITPIDITNAAQPDVKTKVPTTEIETIYPFNNILLVGSPRGMFIYSLTNPAIPNFQSVFSHWRGCDPVVAQNNTAYVTVRGGGPCGGDRNTLDVVDISNINAPTSIRTYQMENPYGLGIYNNTLGICDGKAGFKIFDAAVGNNLQLKNTIAAIEAFDVIMDNNIAMLIAKDGLYQYNIANASNPVLLSKITIVK
jgi:hypothetical protein